MFLRSCACTWIYRCCRFPRPQTLWLRRVLVEQFQWTSGAQTPAKKGLWSSSTESRLPFLSSTRLRPQKDPCVQHGRIDIDRKWSCNNHSLKHNNNNNNNNNNNCNRYNSSGDSNNVQTDGVSCNSRHRYQHHPPSSILSQVGHCPLSNSHPEQQLRAATSLPRCRCPNIDVEKTNNKNKNWTETAMRSCAKNMQLSSTSMRSKRPTDSILHINISNRHNPSTAQQQQEQQKPLGYNLTSSLLRFCSSTTTWFDLNEGVKQHPWRTSGAQAPATREGLAHQGPAS